MSRWFIAAFAALSFVMLLTAFVWFDASTNSAVHPSTAEPVKQSARVLVTNRTLTTGSFIEKSSLAWQDISSLDRAELGDVFLHGIFDAEEIAGSLAYQQIPAGTVLSPQMILRPEESGFLSALLQPGKRAISLELDPSGTGFGLLRPGNHVDVLLTSQSDIEHDANGAPIFNNMAVETVLQNIRLLAIGGNFSPHQKTAAVENSYDPVSVTFEVGLPDAEKLVLASKLGELSLVLRSNGDNSRVEQKPLKWAKDISGAYDMEQQPTQSVTVIRGNTEEDR